MPETKENIRSPEEVFRELAEANETDGNGEAAGAYRDAASYLEREPMLISGELDDAEYRMRQHLGDGEIGGEEFEISLNIDGGAIFVEFEEERVKFPMSAFPPAAFALVYGEVPEEVGDAGE